MARWGVVVLAATVAYWGAMADELPDPATGGRGGGPLDVLLLRGHCEMNFGRQPPLDATYRKRLETLGFRLAEVDEWRALTPAYLRQFNLVIYLSPSPFAGGGYFDATSWRSGPHLLTVRRNADVLRAYVEGGGGLFIVPTVEEIGVRTVESLKELLRPYGLRPECAAVRDLAHAVEVAKVINVFPIHYCWTEALAEHPVTAGQRRVYYPAYCTRWDDNYTTIPLFPADAAWVPLVKSMPGTPSMCLRGTIYDPGATWSVAPGWDNPLLLAARALGKGRLAVTGLSAFHLFYLTYDPKGAFAEANYVRVDGIAMEKGDGQTPSDLGRVLDRLYRWLAAPSVAAGMGGVAPDQRQTLPEPDTTWDARHVSDVWAADDPLTAGPVRPMRVLVGARSALSDGAGTPAEWAAAAVAAGYDVVCFTEALEQLKADQWGAYVAACAAASNERVALLPGLDLATDLGDRFLVVGHTAPLRRHTFSADGTRLEWTGHLLLGMGDVLPIAARPARLATTREHGALPPDLYSHCPGIAVATYRGGEAVDDGRFAYDWHVANASMPIPVAVHEVTAPAALAAAARTGLQCYVNADTPAHAAFYFRQGHASFGGNPMRYYVSSGPLLDYYRIDDWQAPHWTVRLRAHGAAPIRDVTVRDQRGLYRRFLPNAPAVDLAWHGSLARQHWFVVELTDSAGGRALASPLRTLPANAVVRCMDRQNWFHNARTGAGLDVVYTGRPHPAPGPARIGVPGVNLAAAFCPKVQWTWSGQDYVIYDLRYDSTYVPGGRAAGADNSPIFHELPIAEFAGNLRFINFMRGRGVEFRAYEATITLRKDLTPSGPVWPIVAQAAAPKGQALTWTGLDVASGQVVTRPIPADATLDLPAGAIVGNVLLLTPLRAGADGRLGFAPPAGVVQSGTRYHAAFANVAGDPAAWRQACGFTLPTPYILAPRQGRIEAHAFYVTAQAEGGGFAGEVRVGQMPALSRLPLRLAGANPRWALGGWTKAADTITPYEYLDGVGLGRLDVSKDDLFYFGALATASRPELWLTMAQEWTAAGVRLEVHNPTDEPITATVRTAPAIATRRALARDVTVPAGTSIYVAAP